MGYPKRNKEVKETFLYRNYKPVADVIAHIQPGEVKEFFCKTKQAATVLRFNIYAFCRTFYEYLPLTASIVHRVEDNEWSVTVVGLGGTDVEIKG